ncbi:magnesium/cobalt transporter CorA [Segetibacter aerophilus]|uniref:Magnesium transport protein CorA n=1 Tax=Segetibacter aerophilus TaxID=670293 RepID=A0A512BHT2_9BACT|nr:magnesium/cobalt transporter CorA [Segetibacter aerophilus]GEO11518.1 magnesium transporter [Segetibacter aerophilus]
MEGIVNCIAYCEGRRVANIDIAKIRETLLHKDTFVWVGLHEPGEELLKSIQEEFDLHDLAIEDAHNAHQRPKLELYGETMFIVLRTAQINSINHHIDFGETHFFVGDNFIVTVRHGSSLSYKDVRARCENTPELLGKGPAFALYAVMDSIVDQYFPVIETLEQKLLDVEEEIFGKKPTRGTTQRIYELKRELLEVKRVITPLIDICNRLMRFDIKRVPDDTRPYFRDVYDHAVRINEMLDNTRDLVTAALEANFSLTSISQSEVSKKFAGWAAIIGVPTMIAGIYGMNFEAMPELHWHYAYPVVLAVTFVLCIVLYIFFKRSGWL